jgi:hypothetical protein
MLFIAKMTKITDHIDGTYVILSSTAAKILVKQMKEPQRDDESRRMRYERIAGAIALGLQDAGYKNTTAWSVYEGDGEFSIDVLVEIKEGKFRLNLKLK